MISEASRFWSKVDKSGGPNACWPWMASTTKDGYGRFRISKPRLTVSAHRVSYALYVEIDVRDLDSSIVICHFCDNPTCCNPVHLRAGTQADNIYDMNNKGRGSIGERRPGARLNEDDIREIRRRLYLGHSQRKIASDFEVCQQSISRIALGKRWSHVK